MCYPTDYTPFELRAILADAIATARCTRDSLDDALHAMLGTTSPSPATVLPCGDSTPVLAGVGDPILETSNGR